MISPESFVWLILIMYMATGICRIILGATKHKKETHYDMSDIVLGIVTMLIAFCLFLI